MILIYQFTTGWLRRETGPEDVLIKVLYCGICHTDIHQLKNHLGASKYPMVPGYERFSTFAGDGALSTLDILVKNVSFFLFCRWLTHAGTRWWGR